MSRATETDSFNTPGGVRVRTESAAEAYENARMILVDRLDRRRGVLLSSDFEYPGRYTRWDMGFVDPPLEISATGRSARVTALSARGRILANALARRVAGWDFIESHEAGEDGFSVKIRAPAGRFPRGGAEPAALGVLAGARDPALPARAGARTLPRPLRRLRLQPRLPVRAA